MRVYAGEAGARRLIGFAAVSERESPLLEVNILDPASDAIERFKIGCEPMDGPPGLATAERVILLGPGQQPSRLPGWRWLTLHQMEVGEAAVHHLR